MARRLPRQCESKGRGVPCDASLPVMTIIVFARRALLPYADLRKAVYR